MVAQEKLRTEKLSDYFTWVRAIWLTARGTPLDFMSRKYLVDIYRDQYPNIVYMKASQLGISERLISESVWIADQLKMNVLYTFPTQVHLQDFVQARLNPVLTNSEYLRTQIDSGEDKRVEKLGLKRIGKGYIYFRGSQNEKQIVTIDADCIIIDERDRFDENNVPYIEKRLLASKLKWRREASTPTLPGKYIHSSYLASDQRVWQIPCRKCGTWQELDFFKNVDLRKRIIRCYKCKKPLNRFVQGKWTITNPKSKIHGYKINGLYNPTITIAEIVTKYRRAQLTGFSALQQFYNQDLGLPYEATGQKIQVSELDACKKDYMIPITGLKGCYAGVDIGVEYHHVIVIEKMPNAMRLIWAGTIKNFFGPYDSLEAIMNQYDIKLMVIDKKPETTKVKELMDKFPGKVYAVDYPMMKFSVQDYFQWDDVKFELRLDRTISLDYLISDIQNQRLELPQNINMVEDFYDHIRAEERITEKNKRTGTEVAMWIEKGADHYLHALNYARMAQLRDITGQALLDYYAKPQEGLTPSFIDWLRITGERIF